MIVIRFPDSQTECKALGYLAGRFSAKSLSSGETLVPESALAHLANEGISFTVLGPANYDVSIPFARSHSSAQTAASESKGGTGGLR
jgi:hypothetical protein